MLMNLVSWCSVEPWRSFRVAVDLDDGVDVSNRQMTGRSVDLAEDLHSPRQEAGMLAEDGDVPRFDDAMQRPDGRRNFADPCGP